MCVIHSRDTETFLYNYYITQILLKGKKQKDCERVEEKGKFVSQKVDCKQKYFVVSGLGFLIRTEKEDEPKMNILMLQFLFPVMVEGALQSLALVRTMRRRSAARLMYISPLQGPCPEHLQHLYSFILDDTLWNLIHQTAQKSSHVPVTLSNSCI